MQSNRSFKAVALNVSVFLVTLLAMFLLSELIVRTIYGDTIGMFPRYQTDAQYGEFTLRKIHSNAKFIHRSVDGSWKFVTNNRGFRNYENYEYKKPPDTIRILSIGDSSTQGIEVRQGYTFSSIVEKYFLKADVEIEVLNTGVSGFSTAEELIFLENEGIKYDPDIVILGFSGNDLEDNIKAGLFGLDRDNNLVIEKREHIPGVRIQNFIYSLPGVRWLGGNSYFYSLLFNATWEHFKEKLAGTRSENIVEYTVATQTTFSDFQITLASQILKRMYEFCTENNIKLVIIDIPATNYNDEIFSSFPSSLLPAALAYSDAYVDGASLLEEYFNVGELHLPHGQRHISEFTHAVIGVDAAKKIAVFIATNSE